MIGVVVYQKNSTETENILWDCFLRVCITLKHTHFSYFHYEHVKNRGYIK